MGRIVALPSIKPRLTNRRHGLCKLSPDLISKARDETAAQVTRIGLTFVGTAAFCLLSLLTPDSALLGGNEKINVPFAGPVSFFGFMLLGPAVLIALRVYLQMYVEHGDRLDRLARAVSVVRAPTLLPLRNPLIRLFSGLTFYVLLPVTMTLRCRSSKPSNTHPSTPHPAIIAALTLSNAFDRKEKRLNGSMAWLTTTPAATQSRADPQTGNTAARPFNLFRANLSDQWLPQADLRKAELSNANLSNVNLLLANLSNASLSNANLTKAYLPKADLTRAYLTNAKLGGADLTLADLSGAVLNDANLTGALLAVAELSNANLILANLSNVDLSNANLTKTNMTNANLSNSNMTNANLSNALMLITNLSNADLRNANLTGAILSGANLTKANLTKADLTKADLTNAKLGGANLSSTNLSRTDLSGAVLKDTQLIGAHLGDAKITQTQLDEACGNETTKLPEGLTLKPCSPDPYGAPAENR
jgi:uncharacterized protein YjbI with pentapeptide repeats